MVYIYILYFPQTEVPGGDEKAAYLFSNFELIRTSEKVKKLQVRKH